MLAPRCARCPANGRGYEWLRGGRDRDQSTASGSAGRWPLGGPGGPCRARDGYDPWM